MRAPNYGAYIDSLMVSDAWARATFDLGQAMKEREDALAADLERKRRECHLEFLRRLGEMGNA